MISITEALEYIHSVKWTGSKPGLSRTRELLLKLGNPEKRLRFVHIAGTNGKGSAASMIESVLRDAGYKTGLYTSPYISVFNERMQISGEMISDDELCALTEIIRPIVEEMVDTPTEFELITALSFLYFERNNCDIVILEVGLGGELDSTNVIPPPDVAIICALGYDHMAELGASLSEIAAAKAGIIKRGSPVAAYQSDSEAMRVIEEKCALTQSELTVADFSELNIKALSLDGAAFDYGTLKNLKIALAGAYQPKNAALAITALRILRDKGYNVSDDNIVSGLAKARWAGRFETLRREPTVILDGAHNTHGIIAACDSFRRLFPGQPLQFVLGVMADKDVVGMTAPLTEFADRFFTVTPNNPRAMKAEALKQILQGAGVNVNAYDSVSEGVHAAIYAAGSGGVVVALGSLYFSDEIRKAVNMVSSKSVTSHAPEGIAI